MSYADPVSQRSMVLDSVRNLAYRQAMSAVIKPDTVVLDLGAGTGILGLIAASLGAARVYLVEPATPLEVAVEIAQSNELQDQVIPIRGKIEDIELPEDVDVLLSVFTGNMLLEEDLLPSLFYARDRFLKDDGIMLPDCGRMMAAPVSVASYYDENIGCWDVPFLDVNHQVMKKYAVNSLYHDLFNKKPHQLLADAEEFLVLDFNSASEASCSTRRSFRVEASMPLHGFLGWFDMQLGDSWLSTGPAVSATHWSQVFLPIEPVVDVVAGDMVTLEITRPQYGEWSWRCEVGGQAVQHSTFLSRPFTPEQLQKRSTGYQPELGYSGRAAKLVLENMNGSASMADLAARLVKEAGFTSEPAAMKFVQQLVDDYGA